MKKILLLGILMVSFPIYSQVGINTNTPTADLHVYSNTNTSKYLFKVQNTDINSGIFLGSGNAGTPGFWIGSISRHNSYIMANNGAALRINVSDKTISAVNSYTITSVSDRRLKRDIKVITDDKVNLLNPVQYKMNDDEKNRLHFGFIAQEIEEIYPNLVFTNDKGYKSVDYVGLIPILTNELKKQKEELEELKKSILILKQKFKNKH